MCSNPHLTTCVSMRQLMAPVLCCWVGVSYLCCCLLCKVLVCQSWFSFPHSWQWFCLAHVEDFQMSGVFLGCENVALCINLTFIIVAVLAKRSAHLFPFMPTCSSMKMDVVFHVLEFSSNSSHCKRISPVWTLWNSLCMLVFLWCQPSQSFHISYFHHQAHLIH